MLRGNCQSCGSSASGESRRETNPKANDADIRCSGQLGRADMGRPRPYAAGLGQGCGWRNEPARFDTTEDAAWPSDHIGANPLKSNPY
jgi:hypothetical protein